MRQLKITPSITNRDSHSLDQYLNDISKIGMVTPDEEVRLTQLIREGDQEALHKLTRANLRFVVSVSKKFQNQGLSLNDLISEGNLGLIKAAHRFDETKGFKFISYAVWWIRQGILQAIAEQSRTVRLPLNKDGLTNRIQKAYSQLEQQFEREPSPEELAEVLELYIEEIRSTIGIGGRHASVDTPLSEGEDNTLIDVMENTNADRAETNIEHNESLKIDIDRSLQPLTERQKEVICFFFGIGVDHPMSLEDIGDRFSLTRERVRQIKDKAITKLRSNSGAKSLRNYLGS